jgi:hypothetical protein
MPAPDFDQDPGLGASRSSGLPVILCAGPVCSSDREALPDDDGELRLGLEPLVVVTTMPHLLHLAWIVGQVEVVFTIDFAHSYLREPVRCQAAGLFLVVIGVVLPLIAIH